MHSSLVLFYLYTFLMLHVLRVALFVALCCKFSVCTPCFAFSMIQPPVALFSCCILFMLQIFCVKLFLLIFSCSTLFMLYCLNVALLPCSTLFMLCFFLLFLLHFSFFTFFLSHSFN